MIEIIVSYNSLINFMYIAQVKHQVFVTVVQVQCSQGQWSTRTKHKLQVNNNNMNILYRLILVLYYYIMNTSLMFLSSCYILSFLCSRQHS